MHGVVFFALFECVRTLQLFFCCSHNVQSAFYYDTLVSKFRTADDYVWVTQQKTPSVNLFFSPRDFLISLDFYTSILYNYDLSLLG